MLAGAVLIVSHAALGLADALNDDLLGSLCCNAAELLGLDANADKVTQRYTRADLLCVFQRNLGQRILCLVDNFLGCVHVDGLFVHIRLYIYVVALETVVVLFIRGQQCLTYAIEHIIDRNSFFFFQLLQCCKKFCVHV